MCFMVRGLNPTLERALIIKSAHYVLCDREEGRNHLRFIEVLKHLRVVTQCAS